MSKKKTNRGFPLPPPKGTPCFAKSRCSKPVLEASHYATLGSLVVAMVYWTVFNCLRVEQNGIPWPAFVSGIILLATVVYYYVGTWLIEGKLSHHLEELNNPKVQMIEPWIRGGILVVLALLLTFMEIFPPEWLLPIPFALLLFWDWLVGYGGKPWIRQQFVRNDCIGFVLSLAATIALTVLSNSCKIYVPVCIVLLIGILVFIVWQFKETWENLRNECPIMQES